MKSERWQAKRQMVFNHYGKRCYACYNGRGPIQVHHLDYSRLGNERITDLIPLCWGCHRSVTYLYRRNRRRGLRRVTMEFVRVKRRQKAMGDQPDNQGAKRIDKRRKRQKRK